MQSDTSSMHHSIDVERNRKWWSPHCILVPHLQERLRLWKVIALIDLKELLCLLDIDFQMPVEMQSSFNIMGAKMSTVALSPGIGKMRFDLGQGCIPHNWYFSVFAQQKSSDVWLHITNRNRFLHNVTLNSRTSTSVFVTLISPKDAIRHLHWKSRFSYISEETLRSARANQEHCLRAHLHVTDFLHRACYVSMERSSVEIRTPDRKKQSRAHQEHLALRRI